MKYHNITHDDMNNGEGLRVVLWVAGCEHHCKDCHNPITWNPADGQSFTVKEMNEIFTELEKPYIAGMTFSGGDPLHPANRDVICAFIQIIKERFPGKTVWLYTGYTWEEIRVDGATRFIMDFVDVLVEGRFVADLKDANYPWAGSTNQKVIDVPKTLKEGRIILYENH